MRSLPLGGFARDKHSALLKIVRKRVIDLRLDTAMGRNCVVFQHQQQLCKAKGAGSRLTVSDVGLSFMSAFAIDTVP